MSRVPLLWLLLVSVTGVASADDGRFGGALDPSRGRALAAPQPAYDSRPLTIECWAKIRSKRGFHILVANELKSSPTHWEIYSYAGTGGFSLYMPSNRPAEIKSRQDIADGKWHYLAAVLDGRFIRLYVDGEEVAAVKESRPAGLTRQVGPLAIGALVSGQIGCDGQVDEVRLSKTARAIDSVPSAPFEADEHTIGLWHLDAKSKDNAYADASTTGNPAVMHAPRPRPNRQRSLVKLPPEPDLVATRRTLDAALNELSLPRVEVGAVRDGVLRDWEEQFWQLDNRVKGREKLPRGAREQVFDSHALVSASDGDPLGVLLRRTAALLDHLDGKLGARDLAVSKSSLESIRAASDKVAVDEVAQRKGYFLAACLVRRQIALCNPLLDFDALLFVARGVYQGSRKTGPRVTGDFYGQHFATQYFGFNSIPGGGLYVVKDFKAAPEVVDVLRDSVVENGRNRGRRLDRGAFLSPDLSYDGETILFSWTENQAHEYVWSKETTWSIFKVGVDGSRLRQLTDSVHDDFDPCWLPDDRVVFISERRGGYIRCFSSLPVPQHVLHSMKPDGSDLYPISYFETSEWHPSVNNDGMLVYTRWDYTDRENCLGSNIWICYPDGRDPRAPHGNYPYPWHTFADNRRGDSRLGRPYTEMNIRAIPGSHRYILTAAPHHGEAFGSLMMLDLRVPDDGFMSQLERITPFVPFPESEAPGRSQYPYGTAWPLSEDYYLCNRWENIYLLDRFGNRVLLCENSLVFGETDHDMRLIDPIPLRPRPKPPILPTRTYQGERAGPDAPQATISVLDVYDSDLPFPAGVKIRWLRVLQNIVKPNPEMGKPMIGYQNENTPRIPLGIVPVEEDGSVYFEAPVEKELIFQVLDENYMAVQSMRAVAYVHPGEQLSCVGCHEKTQQTPRISEPTMAARRKPSELEPEVGPVEPITYYRLVKPVFEKSCIPCHAEEGKGPVEMSYAALEPYVFYFAGGMRGSTVKPIHGGSRTIPGRFGARASRMGRALLDAAHAGKISAEDYRRVVLWLDANSLRLGAFRDEEKQMRGEVVWPELDVDPDDPVGDE